MREMRDGKLAGDVGVYDEVKRGLHDSLRYTVSLPHDGYTHGVSLAISTLKQEVNLPACSIRSASCTIFCFSMRLPGEVDSTSPGYLLTRVWLLCLRLDQCRVTRRFGRKTTGVRETITRA